MTESTTSFTVGTELYNHYRVRVWREQPVAFDLGDNQDLFDAGRELNREIPGMDSSLCVRKISEALSAIDRVRKVEVLVGPTRQGIVYSGQDT